jgi:prophage antirepressor-like protein
MNVIEKFTQGDKTIDVYGTYEKPLFLAKQIGEMLGLKNIRWNLSNMKSDWKVVSQTYTLGGIQKATFVTEPGLYKLIMRSDKEEAVAFQEWICDEVLPSIRKTGQYQMDNHPIRKQLTFKIENEYDLQKKVINFIKNQYPASVFTAPLGELQDTQEKRLKAYNLGYIKGQPDIIISNLHKTYNGFAIELKSPKGTGALSEPQSKMLSKYKDNNFKTLVSNDYDEIIISIIDYFENVRIACKYCTSRFKSTKTRKNHYKHFHKINKK